MNATASTNKCPGIEFSCMNTLVTAIGSTDTAIAYWQRPVVSWFSTVEHTASRFLAESELVRLNQASVGEAVPLSPLLFQLLRRAWHFAVKTNYLFQPFVGTALKQLGYDRSFESIGRGKLRIKEGAPVYCPVQEPNALEFDESERNVVKRFGGELDLGGIGKGWAVERAASIMSGQFKVGSGLVDAGGDVIVWSDAQPWLIGIQDPWDESKEIMQLWVKNAGIATSNVLHRRWKQADRIHHHILHGETGLPAQTDVVQATVLAPSVDEAEVAAKIICMLGSEKAPAWMNEHFPHLGYVFITQSGEMKVNRMIFQYTIKVV